MKAEIYIKNISELPLVSGGKNDMRKKISCVTVNYEDAVTHFSTALYLDALIAVLVLSGNATVYINYKAYSIRPDTLLVLSSSHPFHFQKCSPDFKCLCLFVSKDFIQDMDSTDMIYRRVKYGVRLYNMPLISLSHAHVMLLCERILTVNKRIDEVNHLYYKETILNSLFTFYLDLSDIIERSEVFVEEGNLTRYESIIKSFIELLASNYREEHKVEFYASRLNLSAHYLTLIVKRVTGQSVADFIFEMLYSEARTLLTHSKLSIQEIASSLNFSDQSSFGKFFKRKSGISPADYRNGRISD